jgi:hypothetical protein
VNFFSSEFNGKTKCQRNKRNQLAIHKYKQEHINQIQINGKISSVFKRWIQWLIIGLVDTILSMAASLYAASPLKIFNPIFSLKQNGRKKMQL